MTLKQQIEATIEAYQEACKPDNLNYKYCFENDLEAGICRYSFFKNYDFLHDKLKQIFSVKYLCLTPQYVNDFTAYKTVHILTLHQTRINFLQNLLNDLNNGTNTTTPSH
jgi:hypothetical protein